MHGRSIDQNLYLATKNGANQGSKEICRAHFPNLAPCCAGGRSNAIVASASTKRIGARRQGGKGGATPLSEGMRGSGALKRSDAIQSAVAAVLCRRLAHLVVLTCLSACYLPSFGGEGQKEEALYASDTGVHGHPLYSDLQAGGGFLSGFFPNFSTGSGTKRLSSTFLITWTQPVRRCNACQISQRTPSRLLRH